MVTKTNIRSGSFVGNSRPWLICVIAMALFSSCERTPTDPQTDIESGESDTSIGEPDSFNAQDDSSSPTGDDTSHTDTPKRSSGADSGKTTTSQIPLSSLKPCLCWKDGDSCLLPGVPVRIKGKTEFKCPKGEVCDGGGAVVSQYPRKIVHGNCYRQCNVDGAEHVGNADCQASIIVSSTQPIHAALAMV